MTDTELRRRVYMETANAIRYYISSTRTNTPELWESPEAKQVQDMILESARVFGIAAMAIHESQQAGVL